MALPKAIQQQVEAADELVQQLTAEKPGESQEPPGEPPETSNLNEPPADPPPVEPQSNTFSQETEVAPKPNVSEESWEVKYHSLRGKYDAEVPRLHADLREMKTQIAQLLADKVAAEAKAEAAQQAAKVQQQSLITEQDKEAFGPDLIDLIERATESKIATFREREADLVGQIKELKSQLGNVSERQVVSDKDRFLMALGQRVPDWEALNVDKGFLEWLQVLDPVYGLPRQAALTSAYEVLDVDRVAAIFNTYKQLVSPATTKARQNNQDLQRQVAPTRSRSSSTTATEVQNNKIYTESEIQQFYNDWRRGYIDNDEAARMEKEIHAAITQGRVR